MILIISEDNVEDMSINLYKQLTEFDTDVKLIEQNTLPYKNNITAFLKDGELKGSIYIETEEIELSKIEAVYIRMGNSNFEDDISELTKMQINKERYIFLNTLFEHMDAMVINRAKSQFFNFSKLYQSWIIKQYGLKIPNSIISNNEQEVKEFINSIGERGVIYKSASSERSRVEKFKKNDLKNLKLLKNCPHLFQECIDGTDIRVHTLATGEVFACSVKSETSDYRYDKSRNIEPCEIPNEIKEICVKMTLDMGLYLSGIDLRKTKDGEYYCFEVNPSPAFSWYEDQTGLPISYAVAKMMMNSKQYKNLAVRKF